MPVERQVERQASACRDELRRPEGRRSTGLRSTLADYLQLSKARIVLMVLLTTAAGFAFGAKHVDWALLVNTLAGTAMVAAGTNALNQYVEREYDAKMRRTRLRPLPDGRISPRAALLFAAAIAAIGTVYLAVAVNWLTALLGAFTLTSYIFVYTPLKRVSTICTVVGALPGAIPPLMGWTAATGSLALGGWVVFAILFLWQLPHFMAISWIYREDYGRAGFAMLAVRDAAGRATGREAVVWSALLVLAGAMPLAFGLVGRAAGVAGVLAAVALFAAAIKFSVDRSTRNARQLFMTSNLYLVAAMLLLVAG
jgi:protoheme IX farnesyltransferase